MNKIIDFRALTDDGRSQRAAINGRVRADFHVVLDDHMADLRHFAMAAFIKNVTVAIRANDRASVNGDALPDLALGIDDDVRKQANVVTKLAIAADVIAAQQRGTRADFHARADDAIGPDVRGGVNLRRGGNGRTRMNTGRLLVGRKKERQ